MKMLAVTKIQKYFYETKINDKYGNNLCTHVYKSAFPAQILDTGSEMSENVMLLFSP